MAPAALQRPSSVKPTAHVGDDASVRHVLSRREFVERTAAAGLAFGAVSLGWPRLLAAAGIAEPTAPDAARYTQDGGEFSLSNAVIGGTWSVADGKFRVLRVSDRVHGTALAPAESAFTLALADSTSIAASEMAVIAGPRTESLPANPRASRLAERLGGRQVTLSLRDPARRMNVTWRAILRDGSRYLRQEIVLESVGAELPVREITLVDMHVPGAVVSGTVKGSPVVAGALFFGFEHPLSQSSVEGDRARCALARELPLRPGTTLVASSVVGVARAGQLRRDFLEYIERERAHPYRTFLHYNSWYDLGYFSPYDEAGALFLRHWVHALGA